MATPCQGNSVLHHELDISTKVSNLEKKASKLESDFNEMLAAAQEIELAVKKYVKKAETEQRSSELLEKITETDANISDVIDHVRIFFNFVIAKMKVQRADLTDVKMLWHLIDCEGISQCFNDVILQCGFSLDDVENLKTLSAVVSRMQVDLEKEVPEINDASLSIIKDTKEEQFDQYTCINSDKIDSNSADKDFEFDQTNVASETKQESVEKVEDTTCGKDKDSEFDETNMSFETKQAIKRDPTCDEVCEVAEVDLEVTGDIEKPKFLDSLKNVDTPIRESMKNMKFVDIEVEMKELIRKIVCYVAKIRFE